MPTLDTVARSAQRDGSASHPSRWLARWLSAELDVVLDSLVDGELAGMPELAVARDDPRGAIKAAARAHLIALAEFVGHPPHDGRVTMPAFIDRHTRTLARRDMPSSTVLLRAFEELHAALWRRLTTALRESPYGLDPANRAEVLELASARLFAYFQTASKETVAAYAAERALLARRAMSRRAQVAASTLAGSLGQAEAEHALGYALNTTHVGYVAWVDSTSKLDRLDAALATLTDHMRARQHLSVPDGERSLFGWVSCHDDSWREVLGNASLPEGVHCAWGAPQQGFAGFRASHLEALEARRVSESVGLARGARPVLFDDVAVASLASRDLASARAFVHRHLGRLAGCDESAARLLETLRVYLEELASPTKASRRLYVHPNTVIKRVERIEAILGRSVDPGSLSLRVAVELAPLAGSTTDP